MTNGFARAAARLIRASYQAYARKGPFLVVFALVAVGSFLLLAILGLTPDPVKTDAAAAPATTTPAVSARTPEQPVKIEIAAIGLAATVADPTTTDLEALDALLLKGAVRYPTSGLLGQDNANVVLFGHSSYLPVVGNQAYKTFNGIQKLHPGDIITVYSLDEVYTYAVNTVTKEDANSAGIPLKVAGRVLTLSTCDSFTKKTDRFVVTANFVESHPSAN